MQPITFFRTNVGDELYNIAHLLNQGYTQDMISAQMSTSSDKYSVSKISMHVQVYNLVKEPKTWAIFYEDVSMEPPLFPMSFYREGDVKKLGQKWLFKLLHEVVAPCHKKRIGSGALADADLLKKQAKSEYVPLFRHFKNYYTFAKPNGRMLVLLRYMLRSSMYKLLASKSFGIQRAAQLKKWGRDPDFAADSNWELRDFLAAVEDGACDEAFELMTGYCSKEVGQHPAKLVYEAAKKCCEVQSDALQHVSIYWYIHFLSSIMQLQLHARYIISLFL